MISPLGCRFLLFEFNCGAVPPGGCIEDGLESPLSLNLTLPSLPLADSSLGELGATDDLEVLNIEVLGKRLLLEDEEPELFVVSALVLLKTCT